MSPDFGCPTISFCRGKTIHVASMTSGRIFHLTPLFLDYWALVASAEHEPSGSCCVCGKRDGPMCHHLCKSAATRQQIWDFIAEN